MGLPRPLFGLFSSFLLQKCWQTFKCSCKTLLMIGYEPGSSRVESDNSANWATTKSLKKLNKKVFYSNIGRSMWVIGRTVSDNQWGIKSYIGPAWEKWLFFLTFYILNWHFTNSLNWCFNIMLLYAQKICETIFSSKHHPDYLQLRC